MKRTPALSFGSSLHATLAHFYSAQVPDPPSLEELLAHLPNVWEKDGYKDEKEESQYIDHAKEVLINFYHANVSSFQIPTAIEHKFQIELDGCTLSGIIDRMDKLQDGSYEIIDYKTARRLPPQARVNSDLQLSIYYLAAQEIWQVNPSKLTLYFLIPNQRMTTTRTDQDVERTKATISQVLGRIEQEKFDPQENALCPWCDFQNLCPIYKHKFTKEKEVAEEKEEALEIEQVVSRYASLRKDKEKAQEEMSQLAEIIHDYCEKHNLERLYSDNAVISRGKRLTQNYDAVKLREILEPLGLWDKIIKVDASSISQLLKDASLAEEVKQAIETAKEVENISYALYVKDLKEEP